MEAVKIKLSASAQEALSFQSYGAAPAIGGVLYKPLKKHRALGGWFMEGLRLSSGEVEGLGTPFALRQLSLSKAVPHRINAFHVHPKEIQDEIWVVVDGRLLVWLADLREGSASLGTRRAYLLDGEEPALLYIPAGVAHGYRAGAEGALLIYAMNAQFDPADPNEGRLPWDHFGAALWEDERG
ncbi:MAG: dTDP-4-dehydrorhamnose 3,5-epimerase family protein [Deinococcota bacterium]|nr:dTDP-4-dehydrorhamnose 3,5-epimerase family protein [Deinococcota bacterium]